jgi:RNA polymerase sigma-70 factor (ECF subfamily)
VLRAHWRARQDANPAADRAEDPWDEVVDRLDSASRAPALVAAIAALPPAERDVLLLVAWEQLTPAQAALALGVPPGTARSRLHRARAALRLVLAEEKA